MSTGAIIAIVVVGDLLFTTLLIWALVRSGWAPLARAYPAQPPREDAVRRRFQSFRFGLFNYGKCVHAAADEDHLHLVPARPLRWLGCRAVSIPWEAIDVVRRGPGRRWMTVRVGSTTVLGPAWCLALAEPGPEAEARA